MPPSATLTSLLHARLGSATIGLPSLAVREIVRAVAIAPLAGAPSIIEGAVNVRGEIVPVVDVRRRLGLPPKTLDPDEFLVVLSLGSRTLALRVDDVHDLVDVVATDIGSPEHLSPALQGMAGIAAHAGGVLVIYDPAGFVSQAEGDATDVALAATR